jgi:hypothetical protein
MLFGTACEIAGKTTAVFVMKLRRLAREVAGVLIPELDSKHGADCRASAAIAATCGAAAEVPAK